MLPLGLVLFLWRGKFQPESKDDAPSLKEVFAKFDYLGVLVFGAAVVTLLLGLQFGGAVYTWSNWRTIVSLTVAGCLYLLFGIVQWWKGTNALVPWGIISNRTMFFSMAYSATLDGAYFILTYGVRTLIAV